MGKRTSFESIKDALPGRRKNHAPEERYDDEAIAELAQAREEGAVESAEVEQVAEAVQESNAKATESSEAQRLVEEITDVEVRIAMLQAKRERLLEGAADLIKATENESAPELPQYETHESLSSKPRLIEMGHAIIDATRTNDLISEKAFASTKQDTRKHRRVSFDPVKDRLPQVEPVLVENTESQPETAPAEEEVTKKAITKRSWDLVSEDLKRVHDNETAPTPKPLPEGTEVLPWLREAAKTEKESTGPKRNAEKADLEEKPVKVTDRKLTAEGKPIFVTYKDEEAEPLIVHETELPQQKVEKVDREEKTEETAPTEPGVYHNNKLVTIIDRQASPDGKSAFVTYKDEDGNSRTVHESELVIISPEAEEQNTEAKGWWDKHRNKFGIHYWRAKWAIAADYVGDKAGALYGRGLNYQVTETMTEVEKQEKREKNRRNIIIGASVLGVAVLGGLAYGLANEIANSGADLPKGNTPGNSPGGEDISDWRAKRFGIPADGVKDLPLTDLEVGVDAPAPAYEAYSNPNYNAVDGIGLEELFNNVGLDGTMLYDNDGALLQQLRAEFPQDLYDMNDGGVGINEGWLSPSLQQRIESLKG
ncbi:MAG: hypothetical protein V4611_02690 [Patescibacteria group bacterium]